MKSMRPSVRRLRATTAAPGYALNSREAVWAPGLAPYAVMHKEQTVGVVAALDLFQARVVVAPERRLPVLLEEISLRHIGSGLVGQRHERSQCRTDDLGLDAATRVVGLMTLDPRIGRRLPCPSDGKGEGVKDLPHLAGIARPEEILFPGIGAVVALHDTRDGLEQGTVPEQPGRNSQHLRFGEGVVGRPRRHPVEERPPRGFRPGLVQSLK